MNRKIVLFPLAMAAILGLAGCSKDNKQPSSIESTQTPSSEVKKASITVDKTTVELQVGEQVLITATVTDAENANKTWTSSNNEVATVAAGTITGVKVGTATITVSLDSDPTVKAEIAVTVVGKKATKTTVKALASGEGILEGTLYEVEGILEGLSHGDAKGNAYLTDIETKATVKIYGLTTTESALTSSGDTVKFTNPSDATTTLAAVNNGEKIKIWGVYTAWAKNISGVLKSHEANATKYTASFEENAHATIALDKTTGLSYGDVVTATVTPEAGYNIDSVKNETIYGAEDATKTADGKFTFTATCVNKLVVTVSKPVVGKVTFNLTDGEGGYLSEFGLSTSYVEASATISGVKFDVTSGAANKYSGWEHNALALRTKSGKEASLVVSGKTFNSYALNYKWWGNKCTLSVFTSEDGTTWGSALQTITPAAGGSYTDDQTLSSAEGFKAAKYIKFAVTTTNSKNDGLGIFSVELDIAA